MTSLPSEAFREGWVPVATNTPGEAASHLPLWKGRIAEAFAPRVHQHWERKSPAGRS